MQSDFVGLLLAKQVTVNVVVPFTAEDQKLYDFTGTVNFANNVGIRVYDDDTTLVIPWSNIQSICWSENNA